ncbi:unnamed protein product, partial [Rotaria sp. Silwood2]
LSKLKEARMSSQPVGVLKDCIACDGSGKSLCFS